MKYTKIIDENKEIETVTKLDCPTLTEMLGRDDLYITATPFPSKGFLELTFSDHISTAAALNKAACSLSDIMDNTRKAYKLSALNRRYRAAEDASEQTEVKCITAPDNETVCTSTAKKANKSKAETDANKVESEESTENKKDKRVVHRDVDKIEEEGYFVNIDTGFAVNEDGEIYVDEHGEPLQVCTSTANAHRNYKAKEKSVFNAMLPNLTFFMTVNIAFMTNPDKIKEAMAKYYKAMREKFGNIFCNLIAYETTKYRDWHTHNLIGFWDEIPPDFSNWTAKYFAKNSPRGKNAVEIKLLETKEEIEEKWYYLNPCHPKKIDTLKYYPPNFRRFETSNGFKISPESRIKNKETAKEIIKEITGEKEISPVRGIGNLIKYKDEIVQTIFKYHIIINDGICQEFWTIYREEMKAATTATTEAESTKPTTTCGKAKTLAVTAPVTVAAPVDVVPPLVEDFPAVPNVADANAHRPTVDEWAVKRSPYFSEYERRLYGY